MTIRRYIVEMDNHDLPEHIVRAKIADALKNIYPLYDNCVKVKDFNSFIASKLARIKNYTDVQYEFTRFLKQRLQYIYTDGKKK